jgi:shikimate kinase
VTRVLLVGCTGSGRTAVGSTLGVRTGWPFLDTDALLERTTGRDARALWEQDGAAALRAAEATSVTLVLAVPGPLVASVGTGVLHSERGRDRLRAGGHVVWLRASVPTLLKRVAGGTGRPWLGDDPAAALEQAVAEESPLCEAVADQVVDVDDRPVAQVARVLLAGLPESARPA